MDFDKEQHIKEDFSRESKLFHISGYVRGGWCICLQDMYQQFEGSFLVHLIRLNEQITLVYLFVQIG